jgi:hypothetical protein
MRLFNTALALLYLTASTVADAADDATTSDETHASFDAERKDANSANNPIEPTPKVAFTKLHDRKTPITAAEILNDRVVPTVQVPKVRRLFAGERWIRTCMGLLLSSSNFGL